MAKVEVAKIEIPEKLIPLKDWLVKNWDEYDARKVVEVKAHIHAVTEYMKEHGFRYTPEFQEFAKQHKVSQADKDYYYYKTDEERHECNIKDAYKIIKNLMQRVNKKCGEIVDYSDISVSIDNFGGMILNGWVKGDKGQATVKSVYAGGYNIQKLHIRVLVK